MAADPTGPYDLAVVGAGIIGAMTAYRAARRSPRPRVLVLDAGTPGAGATGSSAGFDLPSGRGAAQLELAARSAARYRELVAQHPELTRDRVAVRWLVDAAGQAALARSLHGEPPAAADAETERRLAEIFPGFTRSPGTALLTSPPAEHTAPARTVAVLLEQVRAAAPGNAVWPGFAVTEVRRRAGLFDLYAHDGARVSARRLVTATGPWALDGPYGEVARTYGVRCKKVAAYHIPVCPPAGAPALVLEDDDAFLLPQPDRDRWLFSFTSQDWDCAPGSPSMRLGPHDRRLARAVLDRHVPGFAPLLGGGQVHCDGYAPGHLPVVAAAEDGAVLAVAGAGSGYRLAPAIAEDALALLDCLEPPTP
ncbi:hypothetical protein Sgleb_63860 [Streptomyces glebosus]|uniref:FAD dependent oxidoreductase domain-containing protein n=1 Tax=Streptomyces glebosus TaxID=249580 RepID=A0A640T3Q3_9ACTN|nr:FAD-dependent oxidoreductase [Streptomyces glebosus]GFE18339.1 hypothetical protein Sgleb_63860 [Streptomyces glebosus]GHG58183.1 hypothetical protein GCM10010513_22090 [Streptomyces glebosus]